MSEQKPAFGLFQNLPQQSSMTAVESSRAVQEVQASLVIAKRFPRDERAALDRILNACTRPSLANAAVYQYSRGGADVTGPSIRLAETIAQSWGNLQFGIRELEQGNGESTVEAFAWDLETNTRQVKIFQVKHERHTKAAGVKKLTDPRDIYELVANQGARRVRACILGVIPGDIVDEAVKQCDITMSADADASPESQKRIVDSFAKYGVSKDQIEKLIQRRLDSITPAQVVRLRKIMASLKDGMSQPGEWFEAVIPSAEVPKASGKAKAEKPQEAPAQSAREAFWDRCEDSKMDMAKVMELLIANDFTSAEFPGDLEESAAAEMLKPEQWKVLCELYAKGGVK